MGSPERYKTVTCFRSGYGPENTFWSVSGPALLLIRKGISKLYVANIKQKTPITPWNDRV